MVLGLGSAHGLPWALFVVLALFDAGSADPNRARTTRRHHESASSGVMRSSNKAKSSSSLP
jgi:hypothetical protein